MGDTVLRSKLGSMAPSAEDHEARPSSVRSRMDEIEDFLAGIGAGAAKDDGKPTGRDPGGKELVSIGSIQRSSFPPEKEELVWGKLMEAERALREVSAAIARGDEDAPAIVDRAVRRLDECGIEQSHVQDLRANYPWLATLYFRTLFGLADALHVVGATGRAMDLIAGVTQVVNGDEVFTYDYSFAKGHEYPSGNDFSMPCSYSIEDYSWAWNTHMKMLGQLKGQMSCYAMAVKPEPRYYPSIRPGERVLCPRIYEKRFPVSVFDRRGRPMSNGLMTDKGVIKLELGDAQHFERGFVKMYCDDEFHSEYGLRKAEDGLETGLVPLCAGAKSYFKVETPFNDKCERGYGEFALERERKGENEIQATLQWFSWGDWHEDVDLHLWRFVSRASMREKGDRCYYGNCVADGPGKNSVHWGSRSPNDDPYLDIDCIRSSDRCVSETERMRLWGPENIRLSDLERGAIYMVRTHAYSINNMADVRVAVSVGGEIHSIQDIELSQTGQMFDAGYIVYGKAGWTFERYPTPDLSKEFLREVCPDIGPADNLEHWRQFHEVMEEAVAEGSDEAYTALADEIIKTLNADRPTMCQAPDLSRAISAIARSDRWGGISRIIDATRGEWRKGISVLVKALALHDGVPTSVLERAVWLLLASLNNEDDARLKIAVIKALGNIGPVNRSVVPALIAQLKDRNDWIRSNAVKALGKIGATDPQVVPALVKALSDRDGRVRMEAIAALRVMGPEAKEAVPQLVMNLRTWNPVLNNLAMSALVNLGSAAVPALREDLRREYEKGYDRRQRENVMEVLGLIGPDAAAAVPELIAYLGDDDRYVRESAVSALIRIGPASVPSLVEAMRSDDEEIQKNAVEAMSKIDSGFGAAVPELVEALRDDSDWVRRLAAEAMSKIDSGFEAAVPALVGALRDDSDRVREKAAEALGRIGPRAAIAIPELIANLKDDERPVRYAAASALAKIGRTAVHPLIEALEDRHDLVRINAVFALGRIGPPAAPAIPRLVDLLWDENYDVRTNAALALGGIGPAAREATPELRKAIRDWDYAYMGTAERALKMIEGSN